ncbi:MAG: hypothetical protein M5U29_13300 [Anaerolineae bacterium]|nr:hypothetical protein [Anaerolineae bacterium]
MSNDSLSDTPPDPRLPVVQPDSGRPVPSIDHEAEDASPIPVPSGMGVDLHPPISPTGPADAAPFTESETASDSSSVGSSPADTEGTFAGAESAAESPAGVGSDSIGRVQQLLQDGKRAEAFSLITDILMRNPSDPKGLYVYAQLATDRGAAIQALKNALQLQPDYFEARLLLDRLESSPETSPASHAMPSGLPFPPTSLPSPSSDNLLQQMLVQHHMLMEQQMLSQQQLSQQQMLNQQQLAQQQLMTPRPATHILVADSNALAFWLGAVAAFFGFFGVAHMISGRVGTGIVYLLLGFVWDAIAIALTSTVVGACLALPLHLILCYHSAKDGARNVNVVTGTVVKL